MTKMRAEREKEKKTCKTELHGDTWNSEVHSPLLDQRDCQVFFRGLSPCCPLHPETPTARYWLCPFPQNTAGVVESYGCGWVLRSSYKHNFVLQHQHEVLRRKKIIKCRSFVSIAVLLQTCFFFSFLPHQKEAIFIHCSHSSPFRNICFFLHQKNTSLLPPHDPLTT